MTLRRPSWWRPFCDAPSLLAQISRVVARYERETCLTWLDDRGTESKVLTPEYIQVDARSVENLIHDLISEDNIEAAVKGLARGSTPGVDGMPLELYRRAVYI